MMTTTTNISASVKPEGEWASGQVGEWASGRVGEWALGGHCPAAALRAPERCWAQPTLRAAVRVLVGTQFMVRDVVEMFVEF